MLLTEIYRRVQDLDYKPPITLALLAINILLHIDPSFAYPLLGDIGIYNVCLRPTTIINQLTSLFSLLGNNHHHDYTSPSPWWQSFFTSTTTGRSGGGGGGSSSEGWKRLLGSAFVHADDHHLYYNMLSLLWKGIQLETSMGSKVSGGGSGGGGSGSSKSS